MKREEIPSYKEGQMVVVQIDVRGKESGWFVGMILRIVGDKYLVRVSFPREYRRPTYETPKRKWYAKKSTVTRDEKYEGDFHSLWCGWVESPHDSIFVLFSRIASSSFLRDLRQRLEEKGAPSDTVKEYFVPESQILPLDRQKLFQGVLT